MTTINEHVFQIYVFEHGNEEASFYAITRKQAEIQFEQWLDNEPNIVRGWK